MMTSLKELKTLQVPLSKLLTKKNNILPFNNNTASSRGESCVEFLCTKNDCSLFAAATHNKKRPNNLVIRRMFNHQVLDKVEFGIHRFKSMKDYGGLVPKHVSEASHCSYLLVMYGHTTSNIPNTTTTSNPVIHQCQYFIQLKKGTDATADNEMIQKEMKQRYRLSKMKKVLEKEGIYSYITVYRHGTQNKRFSRMAIRQCSKYSNNKRCSLILLYYYLASFPKQKS
jgi:Brix domain